MSETIAVDFDQTLTRNVNYDPYPALGEELPNMEMVRWVNEQTEYNDIVIHTARSEDLREDTQEWLDNHGVQYDKIVMDKFQADIYVDDKAIRPDEAVDARTTGNIRRMIEPGN